LDLIYGLRIISYLTCHYLKNNSEKKP